MSLMILVAFLFVSPSGRLKGERACGQSVMIAAYGTNGRTNQTLVDREAGHAARGRWRRETDVRLQLAGWLRFRRPR